MPNDENPPFSHITAGLATGSGPTSDGGSKPCAPLLQKSGEKKRRPDDLRFFGLPAGWPAIAQPQARAAFSAAFSVGLGRMMALHFSGSAL